MFGADVFLNQPLTLRAAGHSTAAATGDDVAAALDQLGRRGWIRTAYPQAGRIYVEAQSFASHAAVRQAVIAGGGAGALVREVPAPTGQG